MNSMLDLRLPETIGLTILHSLWQITLLWIVLVAVLRLWPKASSAVRYALAIATLTLSVLTIGATAVYEWQSHAGDEETSVMPAGASTQTMHSLYIKVKQSLISSTLDTLNASAPILAWLWFAGLAVMGARFGGSFFYLTRLRAPENLTAIPPAWELELKRLSTALGLKRDVAMATSSRISSPLTLGSLSPMILLPAGLLSGLSAAQIEAILVHELYHIKRRDYAVNIAQAFVEVVLFYHPAVWHINNIIREERENRCDDQTLAFCGDALVYALALTQIQETNILTKPILAMSATGNTTGSFTNRIKRLFNIYPNPAQARSKGFFAIGFLLVYLGIVLASVNVSTAQQTPSAPAEKKDIPLILEDHNNPFGNILSDSTIPVSEQLILLNGKEISHHQMHTILDDKTSQIHSIDIQLADTTVGQGHVRLILKMMGKYIIPGDSLQFSKISEKDSLQIAQSMNYLMHTDQPITFRLDRTAFVSDATPAKSQDTWRTERDPAKQLLIVDGISIGRGMNDIVMKQLDPNTIESIAVYKDRDAIDRYGDEGKDGVIDVRLKPGTSVEEITKTMTSSPRVQVFPNSTNGPLNISFTPAHNATPVKMVLIDSDGKAVKDVTNATYDSVPTTLSLDVTGYKKGIYILQIDIDGARSQHRVVVE
jgi:beta-lactamase regulating signal transducer with metallopeptidase domain